MTTEENSPTYPDRQGVRFTTPEAAAKSSAKFVDGRKRYDICALIYGLLPDDQQRGAPAQKSGEYEWGREHAISFVAQALADGPTRAKFFQDVAALVENYKP